MKFWQVAIAGSNALVLGPCVYGDHFWALRLKLPLFTKAVLLSERIFAEAEPGLIWTDQSWRKITLL